MTAARKPPPRPEVLDRSELAMVMDRAHRFLTRFVAFPSEHAAVATTLWCAHAHVVDVFDSTPRIAFLSPEKGSGKTRALEVIAALVPNPMHAVNCTPAALFRSVADLEGRPTILFDEIDTIFGPKAKDNEEVRGFLNAGHRRSGVAYRCVGLGTAQKVMPFPAFCAVAVAGLNDVPDTIASRAVLVRMRRRAPHEQVAPFRPRKHEPEGQVIAKALGTALAVVQLDPDPTLPAGVTDRPADVWEPLLSIAAAAGDRWPGLAGAACLHFVAAADSEQAMSLSVRLLDDLRTVFADAGDPDAMPGADILDALHQLEEAPWSDLRGKPLDARGLARMLGKYEVRSKNVKVGGKVPKGYARADLWDPWQRYLPAKSATSATDATGVLGGSPEVADQVAEVAVRGPEVADPAAPSRAQVAQVADVADLRRKAHGRPDVEIDTCQTCGQQLLLRQPGRTVCARCEKAS